MQKNKYLLFLAAMMLIVSCGKIEINEKPELTNNAQQEDNEQDFTINTTPDESPSGVDNGQIQLNAMDCVYKYVPEVLQYAVYIDKKTNGKNSFTMMGYFILEDIYKDEERTEYLGKYYSVYVGEQLEETRMLWDWFLVSEDFSEVLWQNPRDLSVLTLDEWRDSVYYREWLKTDEWKDVKSMLNSDQLKTHIDHFEWLGLDNKPYLQANDELPSFCCIYLVDLVIDGTQEMILMRDYPPRTIPACEVFAFTDEGIISIGGFLGYLGSTQNNILNSPSLNGLIPVYLNESGERILFQWVQSCYGNVSRTVCLETNLDLMEYKPIVAHYLYDDDTLQKESFFQISDGAPIERNYIEADLIPTLDGGDYTLSISKDEYNALLESYYSDLKEISDIEYQYITSYHLDNLPVMDLYGNPNSFSDDIQTSNQMIAEAVWKALNSTTSNNNKMVSNQQIDEEKAVADALTVVLHDIIDKSFSEYPEIFKVYPLSRHDLKKFSVIHCPVICSAVRGKVEIYGANTTQT